MMMLEMPRYSPMEENYLLKPEKVDMREEIVQLYFLVLHTEGVRSSTVLSCSRRTVQWRTRHRHALRRRAEDREGASS